MRRRIDKAPNVPRICNSATDREAIGLTADRPIKPAFCTCNCAELRIPPLLGRVQGIFHPAPGPDSAPRSPGHSPPMSAWPSRKMTSVSCPRSSLTVTCRAAHGSVPAPHRLSRRIRPSAAGFDVEPSRPRNCTRSRRPGSCLRARSRECPVALVHAPFQYCRARSAPDASSRDVCTCSC